jgi:hypothetical protein
VFLAVGNHREQLVRLAVAARVFRPIRSVEQQGGRAEVRVLVGLLAVIDEDFETGFLHGFSAAAVRALEVWPDLERAAVAEDGEDHEARGVT